MGLHELTRSAKENTIIILGIAGPAGAGKSSVANHLADRWGFIPLAFTDALYDEVQAAFGLEDQSLLRDRATKEVWARELELDRCSNQDFRYIVKDYFQGQIQSGDPLTPREALQIWGTQYRRAQDPLYWIKATERRIWATQARYPEQRPQHFVIQDVRFPNEQDWLHIGISYGDGFGADWIGSIWHITRPNLTPVNPHESEAGLPVLPGGRELFNGDTLDALLRGVDLMMTSSAPRVYCEPMEADERPEKLSGGQYYATQPDGHKMLCNADGTRSIFDDVDE